MWTLRPLPFEKLAGWAADDHLAALNAFARHAARPQGETYRRGALGIPPESLEDLFRQAGTAAAKADPRAFFEANFALHALAETGGERGLVTAFYEPEIAASRERNDRFATPFHRRPDDLVAVTAANRPLGWDPEIRFARRAADGTLLAYPDREAINAGWLDGRGLEIAWVEDPVDAFFAHIQGVARLKLADGSAMRITYDGKTGHPFTAIGRLLIEMGEIAPDRVSMAAIRGWLADHPDEAGPLMARNRSYIFFRETPVDGPVAAARIQLTPERSLAVDRLLHTFGTPVFVNADNVAGAAWSKLMIAQDTGSAIVGAARGDLFMGCGDKAGERAGAVLSPADFCLLVPNGVRIEPGAAVSP